MTVAELIEELKAMPQGAEVLTQLYTLDYAGDPDVHVRWATRDDDGTWRLWCSDTPPKFSMGYEEAVIIS